MREFKLAERRARSIGARTVPHQSPVMVQFTRLPKISGGEPIGEDTMAVKNVVIPLEVEYLGAAAKARGISRTKLVRVLMQKVIREELVPHLLDDKDLSEEPAQAKYRRFRNSA